MTKDIDGDPKINKEQEDDFPCLDKEQWIFFCLILKYLSFF